MKHFFSLAFLGVFTFLSAQEVTYPYNPDSDNDQFIAVVDVLSSLTVFGEEFLPNEIEIDGQELSVIINQIQLDISVLQLENVALSDTLITLQEQILLLLDSLATSISEMQNVCANCCDDNGDGEMVDVDSDGIDDSVDSCIDQTACNYDADPTEDCNVLDAIDVCGGLCAADNDGDGFCDELTVFGCMDEDACNYNPDATESNDDCIVCDDGNACTLDSCIDGNCVFSPSGPIACDDGNACTYNGVCDMGLCSGIPLVCNDGDPCTIDFCNDGVCESILINCDETCGDIVTHDGYDYSTVQIGGQCWFSENCRYLPTVSPTSASSTTLPYYYVYDYGGTDVTAAQATTNYDTYGVLYNWPAVMTEGICPSGWHIPSDGEWQTLEESLGMSGAEASSTGWRGAPVGDYLKSTSGWDVNDGNGSNYSGFTGLPGGYCSSDGFGHIQSDSYWWSSSNSGGYPWKRRLAYWEQDVFRNADIQSYGFSARCLQD